jgi:putative CocE/NonD family hydrolase
MGVRIPWCVAAIAAAMLVAGSAQAGEVDLHWTVKIPLRDGVRLNATVYTPRGQPAPAPCIFTLTPYISQTYHIRGTYFAGHGLPFLIVDARGRGNSAGNFRPNIQEANDGYDVVEWLAKQPYCNGKVAMWGGSYAGYNQWATAKERPPHLATIVPVASPYSGADFPYRNNITSPYLLQWLFFTAAHTGQDNLFNDGAFWANLWRHRFEQGEAFTTLSQAIDGFDPPALREWIAHPQIDAYWDSYNPTLDQYRALTIPILTITGSYDGDQPGAIAHYRTYMRVASPEARDRHYLIIGPWDHAATRTPRADIGGLKFGPASLVDLPGLHVQWYNWAMAGGPKPEFLRSHVAYYVMGAEKWRYADTLEGVTAEERPYFLDSTANATAVFGSGSLAPGAPGKGRPDSYVYDPHDVSIGKLEADSDAMVTGDAAGYTDQRLVLARDGKQLIYHSAPFAQDTELSGFFRLSAWIAIDQPDTDFEATVYEFDRNGGSIMLSQDVLRARYRESLRVGKLVMTREPLRYDFEHFTFVSRRIAAGSRLRLVIGPMNSIFTQKNYNSGKPVSEETMADARTVNVTLLHDKAHPSALYVPVGQPD